MSCLGRWVISQDWIGFSRRSGCIPLFPLWWWCLHALQTCFCERLFLGCIHQRLCGQRGFLRQCRWWSLFSLSWLVVLAVANWNQPTAWSCPCRYLFCRKKKWFWNPLFYKACRAKIIWSNHEKAPADCSTEAKSLPWKVETTALFFQRKARCLGGTSCAIAFVSLLAESSFGILRGLFPVVLIARTVCFLFLFPCDCFYRSYELVMRSCLRSSTNLFKALPCSIQ